MNAPQAAKSGGVSRPAQHPLAAWREIDGAVVIISPHDSVLHELNETAGFIWKQATGRLTVEEIAALLAQEFDVDEAAALADTRALLAELAGKRLLSDAAGAGGCAEVAHG